MRVQIEDVDLTSPDELVAWNDLMRRGYNATREAAWWRSAEAVVAQYTNPKPGRVRVALRAVVDGQAVGGAEATADPGESVDVEIAVLPEFRRQGVGRALALAVRGRLSSTLAGCPSRSPSRPRRHRTCPSRAPSSLPRSTRRPPRSPNMSRG